MPPTAPRAAVAPPIRPPERGPVGPSRGSFNSHRGPAWNQWVREGLPVYPREPVIPAKRDATGDEKSFSVPPQSPQTNTAGLNTAPPAVLSTKLEESRSERRSVPPAEPTRLEKAHDQSTTGTAGDVNTKIDPAETSRHDKNNLDDVGDPVDAIATDESSDDDAMDLDEEDFESTKAKFEQQKARLQSQLIDLSERQYRAATPLEQIARLANITAQDIPSADELSPTADAPSLEDEERSRSASPTADEDAAQDLLTPKEEEEEEEEEAEDVVMEGSDSLDHVLPPPPSRKEPPEVINLPYLLKSPMTPLSERGMFSERLSRQESSKEAVTAHLRGMAGMEEEIVVNLAEDYASAYRRYREVSYQLEDIRIGREKAERQRSAEVAPEVEASTVPLEASLTESSRRLHKFSSEYDIQQVLKQSEETARIEQEKLEREAKKAKDDLEKEATIPELMSEELCQRRIFRNTNNWRDAYRLTDIYGYEPPADDFTPEEHKKFLDTFKERPKKWGEIAAVLPGRTYQHCIHHYYAFKWDGRFRETKGKRKPRLGRGRGNKVQTRVRGAALMADLSRAEDDVTSSATGVSESGRPKRNATRTTYTDKEADSRSATSAAATPGKKAPPRQDGNVEIGADKPIKRRKAAAGEKLPKKSKAPTLAAAPAGSPLKMERVPERDVQFRPNELSKEDLARVEEASLLAGFQSSYNRVQTEPVPVYASEGFMQANVPVEVSERIRPPGQGPLQRSSASSYWSVPEQQDFVKFVAHFGTDFAAIAAHMGTKTQTMVSTWSLSILSHSRLLTCNRSRTITNVAPKAATARNSSMPQAPQMRREEEERTWVYHQHLRLS